MDELEERFRALGAVKAKLQILVENEASKAFFAHRGYLLETDCEPWGKELVGGRGAARPGDEPGRPRAGREARRWTRRRRRPARGGRPPSSLAVRRAQPRGCCCVMQCTLPPPSTISRPGTVTTSRSGKTPAMISRATSSLGSSNVGRMMPPLTMRKLR